MFNAKTGVEYEYDASNYDNITDMVQKFIAMRMTQCFNLKKVLIPFTDDLEQPENCCRAPIYVSPDWGRNTKRALLLIQGMGSVREGVWSRSV